MDRVRGCVQVLQLAANRAVIECAGRRELSVISEYPGRRAASSCELHWSHQYIRAGARQSHDLVVNILDPVNVVRQQCAMSIKVLGVSWVQASCVQPNRGDSATDEVFRSCFGDAGEG